MEWVAARWSRAGHRMNHKPERSDRLVDFLVNRGKELSPLLIVTHNFPDPDAMASAFALMHLARELAGIRSRIVYGGFIGRAENQTMASVLRIPLGPAMDRDFAGHKHIALVDAQPSFTNHCLPKGREVTLVIDHHRETRKVRAAAAFVQESYGATATILAESLLASGLSIPARIATALVYAIGSETQNLAGGAASRDIQAYVALFPHCDYRRLGEIQHPVRHPSFFFILSKALRQTFTFGEVMGVHLGNIPAPDVPAQIADLLLTHEGVKWVICTGRFGNHLFISLRTRNPRPHADQVLLQLVKNKGSAGGHGRIAGGSITMEEGLPDHKWAEEETDLTVRFLRRIGCRETITFHYPFAKA